MSKPYSAETVQWARRAGVDLSALDGPRQAPPVHPSLIFRILAALLRMNEKQLSRLYDHMQRMVTVEPLDLSPEAIQRIEELVENPPPRDRIRAALARAAAKEDS